METTLWKRETSQTPLLPQTNGVQLEVAKVLERKRKMAHQSDVIGILGFSLVVQRFYSEVWCINRRKS